jgi:hypothetical protein
MMPIVRAVAVLIGLSQSMLFAPSDVNASECRDFGTEPFCAGKCPGGWHEEGFASHECITGRKVRCCKEDDCGPANYGTEGCPYPPFGAGGPSTETPPAPKQPTPAPKEAGRPLKTPEHVDDAIAEPFPPLKTPGDVNDMMKK